MATCYFDHNATTPLRPEAKSAWLAAQEDLWLNPSSPYRAAARVHAHLDAARERLAALFCTAPERVVFNSGATEGNNAVFAHWGASLPEDVQVGVAPTEHPSVLEAARHFLDGRVIPLPLDESGAVDAARIDYTSIGALSVMAANNETGLLNPWREIGAAARAAGIPFHCDASQWIGKLPLDGLAGCGFVTGCAHKFCGPRGAGFLLVPESTGGFCSLAGGAQEDGRRAGTEDVPGILAMLAALEAADKEGPGSGEGRDGFEAELKDLCGVVGQGAARLWNTSLLLLPEFASERWVRLLEKRGFLVSTGAACAAGKAGPSHVLEALGLETGALRRALRVSSGRETSLEDWQRLAGAVRAVHSELQSDRPENTVVDL
ncbi:MAG: cysteine desulfurase family protein [Coraliomargarita sp.]